MKFVIIGMLFLTGCASSYAEKCMRWELKTTENQLVFGGVHKIQTYYCTQYSEVP